MVWKTETKADGSKEKKTLKRLPHILVVEDDDALSTQIQNILSENGYRVVRVGRLREALEKIENEAFDLLLLDVNLPDGDASKFVEQFRLRPRILNGGTPIVLMSGSIYDSLLTTLSKSIQGALVKPFGFDELLARLGNAISKHHQEIENRRKKNGITGLLPKPQAALGTSPKRSPT